MNSRKRIGIAAGALASLMLAGCGTNLMSREEEIQVGREGSRGIEQKYRLSRNQADIELVERIGRRLVQGSNLSTWPWTFKVLDDPMVNAVSLPGGPVYVFRGLLDATGRNESEIAGVMAHELAHVEKRHAAKQYSNQVLVGTLISVGTGGAVETAAQIANLFVQLQYSRNDEYEADTAGIGYAHRAGFDPWGIVRFFEKLQRLQNEGRGNVITNNLRTHPLTSARIERAKQEIARITEAIDRDREALDMIRLE
jgi:predicted Zn-dependent protease